MATIATCCKVVEGGGEPDSILSFDRGIDFVNWLADPEAREIPTHFGIWGGVYARIQRMRKVAHQREQRLTDLLGQFQASASALPDAAVALGSAGEIRWFNDAAQQLLGLRAPQDIGQRLVNLFRSPDLANYLSLGDFNKTLETTARGDRSRKLAVRVNTYGDGQLLLVAQDVTERYLSEQIRKDFVANVSHELRTPLTVISGFVENMLFDEASVPDRWRQPLQLIASQAERMRHIVEDLLLLARLEGASKDTKRETVDVVSLAGTIATEARTLSEGNVEISLKLDSQRCIEGDPAQLRSAFSNLVVNAIHHTPQGGHISLIWRDEGTDSCFEVEDDGEGIAAEHLPRLTERFYRVDAGRSRERGGTGLGLAIVKHILQRHGARLEIHSSVGAGSRFCCRFSTDRLIDPDKVSYIAGATER
ncbi:MAG: phosphate regulon sensor histidine kinase PhoR [Novosphingobium sp.]